MTSRAKRIKRDSVENLYKQCKLTGQCPDDVINKVEGTTLADRLLKIIGSVVYFGGLGIGTGKGSGGATGYRPIGATTPRVTDAIPVRPVVPVDPLVPAELIPVDPGASSIIPLTEAGIPDATLIESGGAVIDAGSAEPPVLTTIDPISDVTAVDNQPTVITGQDENIAVLDIQPTPQAPKRVISGVRSLGKSPFEPQILLPPPDMPAIDVSVFVDAQLVGETVGAELIPLDDINLIEEFEIQEPVTRTSTPEQRLGRAFQRARELYNRQIRQIRTRNRDFLGPVSRAIQFDFENPAFSTDVTLQFDQDVQNVAATPDPDFADVITVHRPQYSETDSGRVRVSRLARRGTIITRSGTQIGENVHFYFDLSTIGSDAADAIELGTIGQHSGETAIVDAVAESTFVDIPNSSEIQFDDEDLLDTQVENFEGGHLVLSGTGRRGAVYSFPTLAPGVAPKIFVDDFAKNLFVSYPISHNKTDIIGPDTLHPLEPPIILDFQSSTYYLHPSLRRRRKRKRSDIYDFLSDGSVDTPEW
ncbi:L2 protein [Human papillomavirus 178]|uniref:Minor capsid protein L2 n=1 Tax=Human papillomavirus 178 TaxID=1478160 RepID=X2GB93_9PAPI|nr:L2 protein [Human papillomavirus 178]AHN16193.1 L2 protein [Human papillomavirus 178]